MYKKRKEIKREQNRNVKRNDEMKGKYNKVFLLAIYLI